MGCGDTCGCYSRGRGSCTNSSDCGTSSVFEERIDVRDNYMIVKKRIICGSYHTHSAVVLISVVVAAEAEVVVTLLVVPAVEVVSPPIRGLF